MAKDFAVRLKCPYGDQDQWLILPSRQETLEQIANTPWDFECPIHGVQREIPLEAHENAVTVASKPPRKAPTQANSLGTGQRSSKRISLRVPVLVYGWTRDGGAFHEDTFTLLVNASGGLVALRTKVKLGDTIFLANRDTEEEQECRVAYVGPQIGGEIRVGVAFRRTAPSFWRTNRQEYRVAKRFRVRVRGVDRNGNRFTQSAYAIDVSRNGARLDGVGYLTWPGETIEVKRLWRNARFRVVWVGEMGSLQANQVGICSLEPNKNIWGVPLP